MTTTEYNNIYNGNNNTMSTYYTKKENYRNKQRSLKSLSRYLKSLETNL